ncbi:MAG: CapA family protein [Bacteroidales bacterium]
MNIIIAGDFCPRRRVEKLIEEKGYEDVFSQVKEITDKADYSILNFEAPVVINDAKPIEKTGPNLKCSKNAVEAIKYAGFNSVTLANNHFYDFGDVGVRDTIDILKEYNIDYFGGGININEAKKTLYKEIKGKKIAFINFCEREWSIATDNTGGSAPLNPIQNHYQIKEAKENADYVIVIVHGGREYYQLPLPRMKETYQFFIDSGADVVVNHHQHCYSGYEIYKGKPIFYGLGNFCFDSIQEKRNKLWEEGFILKLSINDKIDFELIPYVQCGENPNVEILDDRLEFNNKINELNSIIDNVNLLESNFLNQVQKEKSEYFSYLEPIRNRYILALQRRKLFPSFIKNKYKLLLLNLIRCESHKDILEETIKSKSKSK